MCLMHRTEKGAQAREFSKCLNGRSYGERLAKDAFLSPATRGSKKDSDRAVTPAAEAVPVPAHLVPPESPASQAAAPPVRSTLTRAELPQAKKSLESMHEGSLWSCPTLCDPVDCGLSGQGILQARILEHIAQYWLRTLLEHYISCCPSRQLP